MLLDSKLAHILSDFFSDIAKAYFVATFVTPPTNHIRTIAGIFAILLRGLASVILFLIVSWQFAKLEDKL
ncbi:hypothetical protein KKB40_03785 [Patescibacteria group bacterium]|nr:hypothetical protein [Patescibacteria group bacterium]